MRIILAFIILLTPSLSAAVDLGAGGRTYEIAEPDAAREMMQQAAKTDLKKYATQDRLEAAVKKYKPRNHISLPRATENNKRLVDPTYTLSYDIKDGKGNVVYPKGYKFNPLEFVPFTRVVVVINGSDEDQVKWFESSSYASGLQTVLLITEGDFIGLGNRLSRDVYFMTSDYADRLGVRHVPSVVRKKKNYLEVAEIDPGI